MFKVFSMRNSLLIILFIFLSITIATYIENSESKIVAWQIVYSSYWFEFLFYIIVIVLIFNIFYLKMYKKEKLPSFIFHVSFIFIIIGGLVTKHYGFQGQMFIPINKSSNDLVLSKNHLTVNTNINNTNINVSKEIKEKFDEKLMINNKFIEIKEKSFLKNGKKVLVQDTDKGLGVMSFEILTKYERKPFYFHNKASLSLNGVEFLFNIDPTDEAKPYFKIDANEHKRIQFKSNINITTNYEEKLEKNKFHKFSQGIIYDINGNKLLVNEIMTMGKIEFIQDVEDVNGVDGLIVDILYDGKTEELVLTQKNEHFLNFNSQINLNNQLFDISVGKKFYKLPFSIKLNKYILENYPGSNDISTYESNLELTSIENSDYKIVDTIKINKPLVYGFYTIFQAKYKKHDATLLDINYNPGKWLIYLGYILLILGMILNLFNPNSRFRELLSSTNTK